MNSERMHAWSHLVLFLMLFMIALAVMRFSSPTGLAAGNQSISSNGVGDLKPFLTAVGLLMGLFVAAVAVFNVNGFRSHAKPASTVRSAPVEEAPREDPLADINQKLAEIRRKLGR